MGMLTIAMAMMAVKGCMNFKNKLMMLILLEMMFLLAIFAHTTFKPSSVLSVVLLYMMIFMVLDSTMGISILMSSSRNSYYTMQQFNSI